MNCVTGEHKTPESVDNLWSVFIKRTYKPYTIKKWRQHGTKYSLDVRFRRCFMHISHI